MCVYAFVCVCVSVCVCVRERERASHVVDEGSLVLLKCLNFSENVTDERDEGGNGRQVLHHPPNKLVLGHFLRYPNLHTHTHMQSDTQRERFVKLQKSTKKQTKPHQRGLSTTTLALEMEMTLVV